MPQKWVLHLDITNDQGKPLMWPDGFLPVPRSHEVAFLAARFHEETGNDITSAHVLELALDVARKHLAAIHNIQDETAHRIELKKGLDALEVAVKITKDPKRCIRTFRETWQEMHMHRGGPEF